MEAFFDPISPMSCNYARGCTLPEAVTKMPFGLVLNKILLPFQSYLVYYCVSHFIASKVTLTLIKIIKRKKITF